MYRVLQLFLIIYLISQPFTGHSDKNSYREIYRIELPAKFETESEHDIIGLYELKFSNEKIFNKLLSDGEINAHITEKENGSYTIHEKYTLPAFLTRDNKIKLYYPLNHYDEIIRQIKEKDLFVFNIFKTLEYYDFEVSTQGTEFYYTLDIDGILEPYERLV